MCDVEQVGDPAIAAIADEQQGIVDRGQARAAGLGRGAIDHRIARSRLHRLHRGVYATGHSVLAERAAEHAALRACGRHAYLDHRSALEVYGLIEPAGGPIHVTVVAGCRRSREGIVVHRTRRCDPRDFGTFDGLRIVSPARAILDFADTATPRELEQVVNEAQVQGLATPSELRALLERMPGRRGAALLAAVLDRHDRPRQTLSDGEDLLLDALRGARVAEFQTNAPLHGYKVDFYFRDHGLVVEVDSGRYHGTPAAVNRDRRKDAHLRSHGLEVLRYSWWQVSEEIHFVVAEIAARLAAPRA